MKLQVLSKPIILSIYLMFFIASTGTSIAQASRRAPTSKGTITVALYPYVPRIDQFKSAITEAWAKKEPNVSLRFVDWDCYDSDPTSDIDVFVFDAIFLDYFKSKGFLERLSAREVDGIADFLPYALEGARLGGDLYGIPQLGCANILFYRRGDDALAEATTLSQVQSAVGKCIYSDTIPPPGQGLMVDLSGSTSDACLYLEALEDIYGTYTATPPLPTDVTRVDSWAIQNLQMLLGMSSVSQARYSGENPYQRGVWFSDGRGRAMVGFTETMSAMGESGRAVVEMKLLPLSDQADVHLFYVDIIGINPITSTKGTRKLALKLANLIASTKVMLASIGPSSSENHPQYLMPVRKSVFRQLEASFPLYRQMYRLVDNSRPAMFRIGSDSRPWLNAMKKQIRETIFSLPPCPTP